MLTIKSNRLFTHNKRDDVVQCVPTKKGHQILYKGYTYTFKDIEFPEWVSIYFIKKTDDEYCCNICEMTINTTEKSLELLEHVRINHKEVYDVHKENPEATVGFRIEFLHVLKDNEEQKTHSVILEDICEATTAEIVQPITEKGDTNATPIDKKARRVRKKQSSDVGLSENRKRSWVWKYFLRMSNIIFRCNLCNVVLSIKGCNTNNMNRHIRSRHPMVYEAETEKKNNSSLDFSEVETPFAIKTEEICVSDKDMDDLGDGLATPGHRRSWIWLYFTRKSATIAQCRLCSRNICHGGNATGNMNRHLKMIHNKTADDYAWIWKVFDNSESDKFYSCKICQYQCMKFTDADKSVCCILNHLKLEHGVVSGDQIITGSEDCEDEENN